MSKNKGEIRVIVSKVDDTGEKLPPYVLHVPNTYDAFKSILGPGVTLDCAKVIDINGNIDAWFDDDGILKGLKQNRCGLLGTFFLSALNPRTGSQVDLTDEQIRIALRWLDENKDINHPDPRGEKGFTITEFKSVEELFDAMF